MAIPVFDGHDDVLLAERSFADASEDGHLDLARARAGGFAGGFFATFTPHPGGVVGICFHDEFAGTGRADVVRHIRYVADRIGAEHVALGSDFDGCELPEGIRGAQDLPLVLGDLGWEEPELRLLAHQNFLRGLRQVQNAASSRAMPTGSS